MSTLQTLDYTAIIIYMLIMAGVGVFFGWFVKDIKGYFKGGNTIPWGMGGISNFMGLFSTFVFIAYAGVAYQSGIVGVTVLWCTVPPLIFCTLFLAKKWRRSGIITPVEYLETRFNVSVRQAFSWIGMSMRFLDGMVRLYAVGIFIMTATPLGFVESIVISGLIVTLFTIIGGVWSVVVLDTLQFVILVFSTIILVPLSLEAAGGLGNLMTKYPQHFDWFNGPKGQPLWLMVYYIMIIFKYNGSWSFIQRFYSVRDERSSMKLGWLSASLFFIFPLFFLIPAIAAHEILPNLADPEQAYVAVSVKLLPAGLMGLMLSAMFSATMSSLNSEYNVMSGVLTNDIYRRMIAPYKSENHYVAVARVNILLVGALIMVGALFIGQLGGAFEANKLLTGLFGLPVAIPLIGGLISRKPGTVAAILTVAFGFITGMVLNVVPEISWELATLIEIIVCLGVFFGAGMIPRKDLDYDKRVSDFFKKINTPLTEEEKPTIEPKFKAALNIAFAVALGLSGLLFTAMGLFSIGQFSGNMAVGAGFLCIVISGIMFWYGKKSGTKKESVASPELVENF